jgi:hypothetical protein
MSLYRVLAQRATARFARNHCWRRECRVKPPKAARGTAAGQVFRSPPDRLLSTTRAATEALSRGTAPGATLSIVTRIWLHERLPIITTIPPNRRSWSRSRPGPWRWWKFQSCCRCPALNSIRQHRSARRHFLGLETVRGAACDRASVAEVDFLARPSAARRTAAQWIDRDRDFITRHGTST